MKIALRCLILFYFFKISLLYHQTDYSFVFERYEVLFYNKSYIARYEMGHKFVSRYVKKYSLTLCSLEAMDAHKLELHIEGRKFQSNEYRLFPFNYTENACMSINFPKFGSYIDDFNCNFTLACNMEKVCYNCRDIYFDDSKYPPFAPRGRYKLTMRQLYNKTILLSAVELYIQIKPRNPLERTIGV